MIARADAMRLPLFAEAPAAPPDGDPAALYECEDCRIVRPLAELASGCPRCGQTMVRHHPKPMPLFAEEATR